MLNQSICVSENVCSYCRFQRTKYFNM